MRFYLGTHKAVWLSRVSIPLFVSRRTLAGRKTFPKARAPWALDSGGFSELSSYGAWTVPPQQYVREVATFVREIGQLQWAAIQDWMCEPHIIQKTGLSIIEHQRRSVMSLLTLSGLAPELPWAPVLQGWTLDDYHRHVEMYAEHGVDLESYQTVGVGSVCRRQASTQAAGIIRSLACHGLRLHAFGFKLTGLPAIHRHAVSADSMAWSFGARYEPPLPECVGKHKTCANCMTYALRWYERVQSLLKNPPPVQLGLFERAYAA